MAGLGQQVEREREQSREGQDTMDMDILSTALQTEPESKSPSERTASEHPDEFGTLMPSAALCRRSTCAATSRPWKKHSQDQDGDSVSDRDSGVRSQPESKAATRGARGSCPRIARSRTSLRPASFSRPASRLYRARTQGASDDDLGQVQGCTQLTSRFPKPPLLSDGAPGPVTRRRGHSCLIQATGGGINRRGSPRFPSRRKNRCSRASPSGFVPRQQQRPAAQCVVLPPPVEVRRGGKYGRRGRSGNGGTLKT